MKTQKQTRSKRSSAARKRKSAVKPATPADQATAYARAVVAGEIVAGRLVKLACERHLRDLVDGPARGLKWDLEAAERAIAFFGFLRLPLDGELDGMPFALAPSQQFIVGSVFGWKAADGHRRFRTAYVETGKGSGKSPLAAGIGLYGLVADAEGAAEIYAAAVTTAQAGILFRDAARMAESSPALRDRLKIDQFNIAFEKTGSFFRPVSGEPRAKSGPRPHMVLIDEIHEHPNAVVVDKMRAGTKSRRQALIFEITNSGHDRTTVCWQHHEYSAKILERVLANDAWFAYVCQLDPCEPCRAEGQTQPKEGCANCDDWRDERVWLKANPNLGVTIQLKYLREQVEEAKGMPTKEGIVKRLNFCIWTEGFSAAIPMDKWVAAGSQSIVEAAILGADCYAGFDIGATSDFTALSLLFPHGDAETVELPPDAGRPDQPPRRIVRRSYTHKPYFWIPEHPVRRDERMTAIIDGWRRAGHVRTTPGEVVDYQAVLEDICELGTKYHIRECGFDRGYQGAQIGTDLMARFGDLWLYAVLPGLVSLNAPFREFLELLKTGRFYHDNNPVMRWMVSNCVAEEKNGLIKPSKDKSREKIDGVTALVLGLARAMLQPDNDGPKCTWI
jgi:phage terminase large subunit-like protein